MLIPAAVFVAILVIIFGSYWLFVARPEELEEEALKARLKSPGGRPLNKSAGLVKPEERLSAVDSLHAALSRSKLIAGPLEQLIERSGVHTTVGVIVLASFFFGILAAAVALQFRFGIWTLAVAVVAAAAAGSVPILYLKYAASRRLAKLEEQFPDAIDLLARALRAGHALTSALRMAADELPEPTGAEFKLLFEQQNYGMGLPEALRAFASRVQLLDARIFVTALLTQRETGGNLAEVLDNLGSVIRERFKVKRQVRVISAHGRITAWVLGMLPPILAVILFIISPQNMLLLRDDPAGPTIVLVGIALQVIGLLIIRRIVDVEY